MTYANIMTSDHITWKSYTSGIAPPPGVPLEEILQRTGGVYEWTLIFREDFRERARKLAEFSGDEELRVLAERGWVTVSLEHLRHVNPKTRIVTGYELDFTAEESDHLGLGNKGPFDPTVSVRIKINPTDPLRVEES